MLVAQAGSLSHMAPPARHPLWCQLPADAVPLQVLTLSSGAAPYLPLLVPMTWHTGWAAWQHAVSGDAVEVYTQASDSAGTRHAMLVTSTCIKASCAIVPASSLLTCSLAPHSTFTVPN